MNSRERILSAINHKECDRVPTDIWMVDEIKEKLRNYFGVKTDYEVYKKLNIDGIYWIMPKSIYGDEDPFGIQFKKIPLPDGSGFYKEPIEHPLAKFETIDEIEESFRWPNADIYDYSSLNEQLNFYENEVRLGGYISLSYEYELLRGTEQMMIDFATDYDLSMYILEKINSFVSEKTRRILDYANGKIDLSQITDDFGSQSSLLLGKEMTLKYFQPFYEKNIKMVKSYGAKVFHHDDGAITELIPWLIEQDISILNPLQWHLPGWNLEELKNKYGSKLCFHGGIDNQYVIPFGNYKELEQEIFTCIDTLFRDKTGYICAPCHNIQANTSAERIVKMFEIINNFR